MVKKFILTSEIAKAVGVHPNTVRLYEQWGMLPEIPRTPKGYRMFNETHLDQMKLARAAMSFTWLGGEIRQTTYQMVYRGTEGDLGGALELAYQLKVMIQSERAHAESAADFLEKWAGGSPIESTDKKLRIGEVAKLLNTTTDRLRNWERNGLIEVPRNPMNGYRFYRAKEIGRLRVIRALCQARYSHMAILRMLLRLDQGETGDLREVLDTPRDDEDIYYATDKLLSNLADLKIRAEGVIALLGETIEKQQ
ncbi:MAG: MerR family transcriptional regulator [Anaerolineales bacterium]|nr:MerR family transcriptional regulator [Chloroflexota bacterium]MBL6982120.1 MerR family transcriptional regulator [Anaerolineales bacterium]